MTQSAATPQKISRIRKGILAVAAIVAWLLLVWTGTAKPAERQIGRDDAQVQTSVTQAMEKS